MWDAWIVPVSERCWPVCVTQRRSTCALLCAVCVNRSAKCWNAPGWRACSKFNRRSKKPFASSALENQKGTNMLWTIAIILVIMWLLGIVTSYTLGGLLHLLLVLAVIAVLIRIIQGRNPI